MRPWFRGGPARLRPPLAVALLFLACLAACSPRGRAVVSWGAGDEAGLAQARESVRSGIVGPGDVISVRVFQEPDLTGDYRVEADGSLVFPFLDSVPVKDRTPGEIAEEIQTRLSHGWIQAPVVSVFVKEFNSRKVFIFGEVKQPGTLPFTDGMTIIQAITIAGGFTPDALRNRTSVARTIEGSESRVTVPVDRIADGEIPNFPLRPGDIVFVPESPI